MADPSSPPTDQLAAATITDEVPKSKRDPRKAKQIMNLQRRVSLFLTRLKKLIKTREKERLAELTQGIRKAAASSYALWVQDAEEEDDPNYTESKKEFLRQIREGEMTEEIFIQRGLKDALEGKMVIEGDFEEDDKWPPSPSESP
ncbi:uncharacterized protein LOC130713457 [Lotus japonicus]|uniref:uncharacterized protein LOC130713457 n=1 Tax=Lotus japonicus TaxID=34305 RepID=UPI002587FE71|nr:uncharacterized protein LOC130713457 [Lotus japonicus]